MHILSNMKQYHLYETHSNAVIYYKTSILTLKNNFKIHISNFSDLKKK